jgi:hypothetical protein
MKKHLLAFLLPLCVGSASFGAVVVAQYDFNSVADPNNVDTATIAPSTVGANVTVSAISLGDTTNGLDVYLVRNPATAYDNNVLMTGWREDGTNPQTGDAFTADKFFQFTVTPNVGSPLDLTSLDFLVARGGDSGTRLYEIRSNLTGTTSLAGPVEPTAVRSGGTAGMDDISIDLTGYTEFQNLSNPVTFQFAVATTNSTLNLEWDNITVTAVPEPSTYAIFAGLLALGVVMLRRRLRD